jgi:hypothetical protein
MHLTVHLLAPLLVLLPAANAVEPPREPAPGSEREVKVTIRLVVPAGPISRPTAADILPMQRTAGTAGVDLPQQVSIEQRVTIRVSPRQAPMPPMMFDADTESGGTRYVERKFGKCLPMSGIVGVQPASGRKLLLIMRDNRIFTAELKKGCQARDFYSGFLVAKSADGMICKERDELRARSGTTCQVSGFRQIVALDI